MSPNALTAIQRGNRQAVRQADGCGAQTGLHGPPGAGQLADGCPGPGADIALDHRAAGGRLGRPVAALGGGADAGVANAQVVQDGGRNDRHFCRRGDKTDAAFFEVVDDPAAAARPKALPPASTTA